MRTGLLIRLVLVIYLTPCVPLSFKGEGEVLGKRGYAPLRLSFNLYPLEGGRGKSYV